MVDPFLSWPSEVRKQLVDDIRSKARHMDENGDPAPAHGAELIADYIETGEWYE